MKYVIMAKAGSKRVPLKNWREFCDGQSLVDIAVEKLLKEGVKHRDIFISTELDIPEQQELRGSDIHFLAEDPYEAFDNDYPLTSTIREIVSKVPGDDDIAWCQVCDPLFDQYQEVFDKWVQVRDDHDSICVVHPVKQYLLDPQYNPIGWQFGEHHTSSQRLPQMYQMPFTMSILKRETIERFGYHIGGNCHFFESDGKHVDIDDKGDFEIARLLYSQ